MSDKKLSIKDLTDQARSLTTFLDWKKFHTPNELSVALTVEVGELLEHFLWQKDEEIIERIQKDPEFKQKISDEVADILMLLLFFADEFDIDLETIFLRKYQKIKEKYIPYKGTAKYKVQKNFKKE